MKGWASGFYLSRSWRNTRDAYMASQHHLCERCPNAAEIVHHRVYVTKHNVDNPSITLAWDNLEALCRACHEREHRGAPAVAQGMRIVGGRVCPPLK